MRWIAGLLMALLIAMPLAVADELDGQATVKGNAASAMDLRFRQMGEGFGDFVFHVKAFLTFDEKAKVELMKERNADLQARQEAWLETKADALARFRSENLTAEQKQEVIGVIQAEHEAIIKEHLKTTEEIREMQLKAKARGDAELESRAEAAARSAEASRLSVGLKLVGDGASDGMLKLKVKMVADGDGEASAVTAEEAQAMVENEFDIGATTVTTVTEGGRTVFVVTGSETETEGRFVMTKEITAKVDAETGAVTSVDFDAHFQTTAEGNASVNSSGCRGFLCLGIGISSEAEAESEAESSGSAQAGGGASSEESAQASGGAHASANAGVSGGSSIGGQSNGASAGGSGNAGSRISVRIG
ncbi:MAG: hypothetical protein HYW26_03930 [Candidatus Aenigmarchaeota archaeon]|nr:hypothetical protein [Candidatus Aenigmarchaeota archaeon]